MTCRQSPKGDAQGVGECREPEGMEPMAELGESSELAYSSNFEQWDNYWEDLTKYTRLTSCDIWGTKEVDFLGLDDFSSPYQDEDVISRTPTLAQLNSEDSQPVCDTLYHPDLLQTGSKQPMSLPSLSASQGKKVGRPPMASLSYSSSPSAGSASQNLLPDFPEGSQKATWPVASSTETMAKAHLTFSKAPILTALEGGVSSVMGGIGGGSEFVRKAKVRVSGPYQFTGRLPDPQASASPSSSCSLVELPKGATATSSQAAQRPGASRAATLASLSGPPPATGDRKVAAEGSIKHEVPGGTEMGTSSGVPTKLQFSAMPGASESLLPVVGVAVVDTAMTVAEAAATTAAAGDKNKEEEHNYSLFLTRARLAGKPLVEEEEPEEEPDEEEEDEEEGEEGEEEDDEGGLELDDEDHDEGFGSEHELSENDDDDEDEDEDYEGDKDDISDAFSEPGTKNLLNHTNGAPLLTTISKLGEYFRPQGISLQCQQNPLTSYTEADRN